MGRFAAHCVYMCVSVGGGGPPHSEGTADSSHLTPLDGRSNGSMANAALVSVTIKCMKSDLELDSSYTYSQKCHVQSCKIIVNME